MKWGVLMDIDHLFKSGCKRCLPYEGLRCRRQSDGSRFRHQSDGSRFWRQSDGSSCRRFDMIHLIHHFNVYFRSWDCGLYCLQQFEVSTSIRHFEILTSIRQHEISTSIRRFDVFRILTFLTFYVNPTSIWRFEVSMSIRRFEISTLIWQFQPFNMIIFNYFYFRSWGSHHVGLTSIPRFRCQSDGSRFWRFNIKFRMKHFHKNFSNFSTKKNQNFSNFQ